MLNRRMSRSFFIFCLNPIVMFFRYCGTSVCFIVETSQMWLCFALNMGFGGSLRFTKVGGCLRGLFNVDTIAVFFCSQMGFMWIPLLARKSVLIMLCASSYCVCCGVAGGIFRLY